MLYVLGGRREAIKVDFASTHPEKAERISTSYKRGAVFREHRGISHQFNIFFGAGCKAHYSTFIFILLPLFSFFLSEHINHALLDEWRERRWKSEFDFSLDLHSNEVFRVEIFGQNLHVVLPTSITFRSFMIDEDLQLAHITVFRRPPRWLNMLRSSDMQRNWICQENYI